MKILSGAVFMAMLFAGLVTAEDSEAPMLAGSCAAMYLEFDEVFVKVSEEAVEKLPEDWDGEKWSTTLSDGKSGTCVYTIEHDFDTGVTTETFIFKAYTPSDLTYTTPGKQPLQISYQDTGEYPVEERFTGRIDVEGWNPGYAVFNEKGVYESEEDEGTLSGTVELNGFVFAAADFEKQLSVFRGLMSN